MRPSWLTATGLTGLLVVAGCGKSNWSAGTEAGAGSSLGGRPGSFDANVADSPVGIGGGGAGAVAVGGLAIVDAPVAAAGRVGTGGASLGAVGGAAAGRAGAGGVGGATIVGGATGLGGVAGTGLGGAGGRGAGGGGGAGGLPPTGGGLGGAGGLPGTGASRPTGGLPGLGGMGGRGGSTSTGGRTGSFDAGVRDGAWWANDAGIKVCPSYMDSKTCDPGGPSICVVAGSYDAYHCNQYGMWERDPDSCPGLLVTGDTCVGQFTCLYPSYWYCSCPGMGFPASCGDARTMGFLDPRDAAPPVDSGHPLLPCPDDVQTASCTGEQEHFCVLPNGLELCRCNGTGTWTCTVPGCPDAPALRMACSVDAGTLLMCKGTAGDVCYCTINGIFVCARF